MGCPFANCSFEGASTSGVRAGIWEGGPVPLDQTDGGGSGSIHLALWEQQSPTSNNKNAICWLQRLHTNTPARTSCNTCSFIRSFYFLIRWVFIVNSTKRTETQHLKIKMSPLPLKLNFQLICQSDTHAPHVARTCTLLHTKTQAAQSAHPIPNPSLYGTTSFATTQPWNPPTSTPSVLNSLALPESSEAPAEWGSSLGNNKARSS